MVLHFEFPFFVILATLLLLCVVVAKLRDMAEARTAAEPASPSSPGSRKDSAGDEPVASRGDDRTAREVGTAGSEGSDGVRAGTGTELWTKEFRGGSVGGDNDDWEGVERSEWARLFGRAVRFACSARNAGLISGIHGEPTAKLYGLHKVALEGPCGDRRPMAFRVSARAKWNAWRQLGNTSPEVAMEEYINLLSEKFPNWMQNDGVEEEEEDCTDAETFWKLICNLRTVMEQQTKRKLTETDHRS
ncbi:acyl-CoA-binding domain-containing protein 5-like isoform X2 [Syzygium oleosum]|uniref:acyl-CoA-binding domain-containing protein 5-like isoform X2 n=1 Tax=Syzygium oleosum TaxID=219896 RepID=UPI0024BB78E4|nr:acyl-CoA-binding domain-containing protein 5-like isoform X2 [Syzygium oleosum]